MKEKICLLTLLLLLVACSNDESSYKAKNMKGNIIHTNPFEYLIELEEFDGTFKKSIDLHSALGIEVNFKTELGTLAVELRDENGRLVYQNRKETNLISDKKYLDINHGKYELTWIGTKVKNGKILIKLF